MLKFISMSAEAQLRFPTMKVLKAIAKKLLLNVHEALYLAHSLSLGWSHQHAFFAENCGEIRDIMNTVLIAEKRAQANVITRREEVASTRSLLNTAKLMEENPTLYRLKELEHIERICENVGNINLNGNGDVLSQLMGLMHPGTAS